MDFGVNGIYGFAQLMNTHLSVFAEVIVASDVLLIESIKACLTEMTLSTTKRD